VNTIIANIESFRQEIPPEIKIIAVSKSKSVEDIREAMSTGQIRFGENRTMELLSKNKQIPEAEWHFIGHLQTNKVKHIAPFVKMIQSVDSFRLLEEINREAQKHHRIIDCLLQVHISAEKQKFGFSNDEIFGLLEMPELLSLQNVRICGLMGMATHTNIPTLVRFEFRQLARLYQQVKERFFPDSPFFSELSMGMSNDYLIAIEEGCTMVRIGHYIFDA
jgi:pyridoxal phosphate enzyme (YggS family)